MDIRVFKGGGHNQLSFTAGQTVVGTELALSQSTLARAFLSCNYFPIRFINLMKSQGELRNDGLHFG
jgi:hypothetical protein